MDPTTLLYALSAIAQCAAALAALIGFLGLWRLDKIRGDLEQAHHLLRDVLPRARSGVGDTRILPMQQIIQEARAAVENSRTLQPNPPSDPERAAEYRLVSSYLAVTQKLKEILDRRDALERTLRRGMGVLTIFLVITLGILGLALAGIVRINQIETWAWLPQFLFGSMVWLVLAPVCVVCQAALSIRALAIIILLLGATSPATASPTRCLTYEDKTLGRLHTVCTDGTRGVHTWNQSSPKLSGSSSLLVMIFGLSFALQEFTGTITPTSPVPMHDGNQRRARDLHQGL